MAKRGEHTFDFLTGSEGDFMETVMNELADKRWAIGVAQLRHGWSEKATPSKSTVLK
jgi:hypothetical protein